MPWKIHGKSITGSDSDIYVLAEQDADERIPLGHDAWLLVKRTSETWLEFAVFEFSCGEASDGSPTEHTMLFHGEGAADVLRECRHIWWGENGYTFYLNFAIVEAALKELRRWFDGD